MVAHRETRPHLGHDLAEAVGRRMDVGRDHHGLSWREPQVGGKAIGRVEALVDDEIAAAGLLDEPLVRGAVAAEDEAEAVPVQAVAYGAVEGVDRRRRGDRDPVRLVQANRPAASALYSSVSLRPIRQILR